VTAPTLGKKRGINMAKKKKAKRTTAKKKASARPLPTEFMIQFGGLLSQSSRGQPTQRLWPPAGQLPGQSFADITGVLNMLGNAFVNSAPPAAAAGADIVSRATTLANQYPWPTNPVYASRKYRWWKTTINVYEISRVAEMMLRAMSMGAADTGGGGSKWPPAK
jgi:hypothetical protein